MFATKIRNPQAKLLKDVQHFSEDPKTRAARIVNIGRQEGYDFVKSAALGLLDISRDDQDWAAFHYAALLTQPQWKFHKTDSPSTTAVVVEDEGEVVVIGKCTTEGSETASVDLLMDSTGITVLESTDDPRNAYVSTFIKQKVYRMGKRYYLVDCAKDVLHLQHFYSDDQIKPTRKPGYLWKFAAYVVTDGPFHTKADAQEAKVKSHEVK
jgi:hypothetical protein